MEKLEFIDENGEKTQFYVIEETRINGINYLLVSESDNEDEEAEAYILRIHLMRQVKKLFMSL